MEVKEGTLSDFALIACVADVWRLDVVLPVDAEEFSAVVDFLLDYVD